MFPILFVLAASAAPACPAKPAPLPAELAGWPMAKALKAASSGEAAAQAPLTLGQSADLTLVLERVMSFAASPGRAKDDPSFGGLASIRIDKAGTYRVTLDSPAWIDLVAGGAALKSTGHSHGTDCSGIGKMVDFRLEPGTYLVQLAGSVPDKVRVLVTAVPGA